jgi:uncharacterized protein (DUF302 family)
MHCFSTCIARPFAEALALAKLALERHDFAVLGQVDVREALQGYAAVDFGPYVILSACSLRLAKNAALSADDQIGPMLLSNLVVRERRQGMVEIAAVDPAATIGSLNDVDMIQTANNLRCRLRTAIEEIASLADAGPVPRGRAVCLPSVPTGAAA